MPPSTPSVPSGSGCQHTSQCLTRLPHSFVGAPLLVELSVRQALSLNQRPCLRFHKQRHALSPACPQAHRVCPQAVAEAGVRQTRHAAHHPAAPCWCSGQQHQPTAPPWCQQKRGGGAESVKYLCWFRGECISHPPAVTSWPRGGEQ